MDDINNHTLDLPQYPDIPANGIPQAIIEDPSEQYYLVSFDPNNAGIIVEEPRLIDKQELSQHYPHIIKAWVDKLRREKETANAQVFLNVARQVLDRPSPPTKMPAHRGVPCDQKLLPGMAQHWGESRKCEVHPPGRPEARVCKGCRVAHYALESGAFDRKVVMARGARVPVCTHCAEKAVASHGAGDIGCVCDTRWSCFRCREAELTKLAKAREAYVEGQCGDCRRPGKVVQHVDFCLRCRKHRVYSTQSVS